MDQILFRTCFPILSVGIAYLSPIINWNPLKTLLAQSLFPFIRILN